MAEITFTEYDSKMFKNSNPDFKQLLEKEFVTFNVHHLGTTTVEWEKNKLGEFFNVVTTSLDDNGKVVISSMEAKDYPIYGVQYHPEKSPYNPAPLENMRRNNNTLQLSEDLAFFFVDEC